ncbi:hypothetical protein D3C73_1338130 [compost metagenome]
MSCAHLPCAFGECHHHVQIHRAKRLLRAGLLDGGAQAAVGDVDAAVQLRQELNGVAHWVFQVRMLGQRPARGGQYSRYRWLVEQAIE